MQSSLHNTEVLSMSVPICSAIKISEAIHVNTIPQGQLILICFQVKICAFMPFKAIISYDSNTLYNTSIFLNKCNTLFFRRSRILSFVTVPTRYNYFILPYTRTHAETHTQSQPHARVRAYEYVLMIICFQCISLLSCDRSKIQDLNMSLHLNPSHASLTISS